MTGLFYPQHILYVKASELAFEDCLYSKNWEDAIDYGSLCLNSYKKYTLGDQASSFPTFIMCTLISVNFFSFGYLKLETPLCKNEHTQRKS